MMRRRAILAGLAILSVGCPAPAPPPLPPPPPRPKPPPEVVVENLTDLLTLARLDWLVMLRPKQLAGTPWLRPSIARVLRDERMDLLAKSTGLDLRSIPEIALAGHAGDHGEVVTWLLRHQGDALAIERKFRDRLTGDEERSEQGYQLVGVWGKVALSSRGFVAIGRDVVGYQYGGPRRKGPAMIAMLYAQGKLADIPTPLADSALGRIDSELGITPAKVLLPGPFDGDLGRGLRGLLGGADGLGASLVLTEAETLLLTLLLAGDYGQDEEQQRALGFLEGAWQDLVSADLGHLLGLHEPAAPPKTFGLPFGIGMSVELRADILFDGLAAATVDNIREIMK